MTSLFRNKLAAGWLSFFAGAWALTAIDDALHNLTGLHLWSVILANAVIGLLIIRSVWRDRA